MNRGFHNIGSIFFDIKALSNSLGTGLDKLDEKPNKLHIPRNKVARSVNNRTLNFVCLFSLSDVCSQRSKVKQRELSCRELTANSL